MNNKFEKLEVLSPAGSAECFFANIAAGCDAVYLGLSSFNARMKAQNFTVENIREYIKFAHKHSVKVYVTTNTLLTDDDFDDFLEMAKVLVESKIDAFIVQDFGVAKLLKDSFDNIVLHSSTQMGIHNLAGAKVAEKLGFSRIVLSREAALQDIIEIKNNTNLEIEYFVQGALCVAFSGNCYFSSLEKSASGNEGKCLQLCRLPYKNNIDDKTAYYLSARDLSLLENLEELIAAGVTSFKIEGRMRHSGYTATATKIYKTAIEKLKTASLSKEFLTNCENELKISYSRGDYNKAAYLKKHTDEPVIYSDYQNHIGKEIGFVKSVKPFKNNLNKAVLVLNEEISAGDGLKFINHKTKEQVASIGVGNVEKLPNGEFAIYTTHNFYSGLSVHLTQSAKNEEKILKNKKKIKLNIKISAFSGKNLKIAAKSNESQIEYISDYILESATKSPLDKNSFISQFEKLSDTDFELADLLLETDNIFLPKSKINEARRTVISMIEEQVIFDNEKQITAKFNPQSNEQIFRKKIISNPANIVIFSENNDIQTVEPNTIYVYKPSIYLIDDILKTEAKFKNNFAISVPTILKFEDKILFENILQKLSKTTKLFANNISSLYYSFEGFDVIASPLLNIKNKYAINCLNDLNVSTICASIEADDEFVSKYNLIGFAEGNFPLMTFAHCPYKVVTKSTCNSCKFNGKLAYSNPNLSSYKISRTKLANCQFELNKVISNQKFKFFVKNLNY